MFLTSLDLTRSDGDWSHTGMTTWTPSHNIPEIGQKFKPSQAQLDTSRAGPGIQVCVL